MERMTIVVRDDAFDRLLTPLTFAYVQARKGVKIDMLFVLWAVRVLTAEGAAAVRVEAGHADEEAWLRERLASAGDPADIRTFLDLIKRTGRVRLYACRLAAATFGVTPERLLPEADGIVDSVWFLDEKAAKADHCQYF